MRRSPSLSVPRLGSDDNLAKKVSAGDLVQVACRKGGIARKVNLGTYLAASSHPPTLPTLAGMAVDRFLRCGLSLAFVL